MLVIAVLIYFGKRNTTESPNIIKDTKTYTKTWRSPKGSELVDIGKIIVANGVKVCGEYQVKLIQEGEYIVACTDDGTNWNYFVVYRYSEKIFRANDEMESKLTPPR